MVVNEQCSPYTKTSLLICSANQLTDSYMRGDPRSLIAYIVAGPLTYPCIKKQIFTKSMEGYHF